MFWFDSKINYCRYFYTLDFNNWVQPLILRAVISTFNFSLRFLTRKYKIHHHRSISNKNKQQITLYLLRDENANALEADLKRKWAENKTTWSSHFAVPRKKKPPDPLFEHDR